MPTKKSACQAGFGRIVDHHIEAREAQRAGDREDEHGEPAEPLDLMQRPQIQQQSRRDAEIDEIGKRVEFGAKARRAFQRARKASIESIEHRRRHHRRHGGFETPFDRIADRGQPHRQREQRDEIGQHDAQRNVAEAKTTLLRGRQRAFMRVVLREEGIGHRALSPL